MKNKIIKSLIVFVFMLGIVMPAFPLQAKNKKETVPEVTQQALPKAAVKVKKVSRPAPRKIETVAKVDDNLLKNIEILSDQVVGQVTGKKNDETNNVLEANDEEPIVLEDAPNVEIIKSAPLDTDKTDVLTPLDVMKNQNQVLVTTPNILDSKVQESLPWSKTLIITAFMICTLLTLAFIYSKKFRKDSFGANPLGKQMKLIQSLSLGYKKSVALVEWNKKVVMLGISENNVNFVSITDSTNPVTENAEVKPSFHDLLTSESIMADSVKVNLSETSTFGYVPVEESKPSDLKSIPVSERIKGKIGALKSPGFKPLPISNLSSRPSPKPVSQGNSFVVDYSSERGFLKE
ncbi:MAG: hypothetical protein ACD_73C00814G0005 [uncultured bacterium]|nr:MAG: hypothetical protein ACD_73C00814G0005 [uncultured bacterium]